MDENAILDWKEANAELYSKFKHDLEEQLQKPYHQTILDISDGNAEPLQSVVLNLILHQISQANFLSRISPEFHRVQNKNEPHLCNSLIFNVAGAGIEPATS